MPLGPGRYPDNKIRRTYREEPTPSGEPYTFLDETPSLSEREKPTRPDAEQLRAIRAWARAQGMKVGSRGQVPQRIIDAFKAAHDGHVDKGSS